MISLESRIFTQAQQLLTQLYGAGAAFRDGQYEAIKAALTRRRTLVVQRTGWGKSLVYFICTKLLREQGKGLTMVVSPLLVLMQNQMEAANRLGLTCAQLNGRTKKSRQEILDRMVRGELDLVFITPETLFHKDVQEKLRQIVIGLFVIDEAHCISDWGHDFRLEYSRLKEVINQLPANVPVLATTATANDRVVADLRSQLGEDVFVSRGPLARESLRLQVLPLEGRSERYGWIAENLKQLSGSGIIYCLTQRDCDLLADFLKSQGISAAAYHSGLDDEVNQETEELFQQNQLKVIVATIKLGMGYDKGDISFVIHFQMPSNIVSYYQQIGRAGRNIPQADVFLMSGPEDEEIIEHFIETAFPTKRETDSMMSYIQEQEGASQGMLESALNIRSSRIKKALMFLCNDGFLFKEGSKYYAAPKPYVYQQEHYHQIKDQRRLEMEQMKELTHTRECLSKYVIRCLDDPEARDCGCCSNCTGRDILPSAPSLEALEASASYLHDLLIPILPRKKWPAGVMEKTTMTHMNQEGLCLSRYGDAGWGRMVKEGKYSPQKRFSEELVQRSAQALAPLVEREGIGHITHVPSLRTDLVEDFTRRLAERMGLTFVPLLKKRPAQPQKDMENGAYQCRNALESFYVAEDGQVPAKLLLVDDVVDSRWTLTVCGFQLMERGCEAVWPFALADSGQSD